MNSKITNILLALPLLLLSACSADDSGTHSDRGYAKGEDRKIRFTASVANSVRNNVDLTRSWADTYNDHLPMNAPVYVYLYAYNDSESEAIDVANYMFKEKMGETWTSAWVYETQSEYDVASGRSPLAQTYPTAAQTTSGDAEDAQPVFPASLTSNDAYVDAIGIFLPEGGGNNTSVGGGTLTFTVPSMQTTQAAVVSADLLTNDVTSTFKSDASAINLELKHRMAKVLVEFNPTEDLTSENMPNNTYSVQNVYTERTLTIKTGTITTTGSTQTITAKVGEPFFMPPQTIPSETQLLQFDLRNVGGTATGIKNVTLKTTSALEFQEGVFYILTVNVGVRYITLTTTIRDWTGEAMTFDKIIL